MKSLLKKNMIFLLVFFGGLFLSLAYAKAGIIKKGSISLGGSSSSFFSSRNFDKGEDNNTIKMAIEGGYFIIDNLELGVSLSFERQDGDNMYNTGYIIVPAITYHSPSDNKENIYISTGICYTMNKTKYISGAQFDEDSIGFAVEFGWEYFFNPHVAVNVGLNTKWIEWDLKGYSIGNATETRITPGAGLKIFF
ncbi:MAG: outer membrane beta-barrel protein [bacterium]